MTVPPPHMDFVPTKLFSQDDLAEIEHLLKNSAQRAYMGNRPSDIVNVLLIGTRKQLDRAFHASGWSQAQRKSPMSLYRMFHALTKRMGYRCRRVKKFCGCMERSTSISACGIFTRSCAKCMASN